MELPETSLLVAFEAVARLRNFRKAADELNLTPSAVSHRLKTLETQLGQPLLIRTTRTVETSAAGARILPSIEVILQDLRGACQSLKTGVDVVTIVTTDSVATCWLIDRLPAIAESANVEVRILTRPAGFDFDPAAAEFAIAYGNEHDWLDDAPLLLANEIISPVCSPAVAAGITSLADLLTLPLVGDQNLEIDWPGFAAKTGCSPETVASAAPSTSFSHSHLALRAAASGQGIALASSPLADDAINRGELVNPVAAAVTTGKGYFLVASQRRSTPKTAEIRNAFEHAVMVEAPTNPSSSETDQTRR